MSSLVTDLSSLGDKPEGLITVSVIFLALAWTVVILRVWVRAFMIRSFGWDDLTMLITVGLFTGLCSCLIVIGRIEVGEDLKAAAELGKYAELPTMARLMNIIVVFMGLYLWVTVVLKISLAIFFLRVITKSWHRKVVYITTVIYTLYGISFAFIGIFQCGNPKNFLGNELTGNCLSNEILQPMNYIAGTLNAITDWIYVFFPLHVVYKAPMPQSAKISAGVLLMLGAMGSVSSLVRIAYIPGIKAGPHFFSKAIAVGTWSVIEPGIGVCAGCLATLRPLFKSAMDTTRTMKSLGSSRRGGSSGWSRTSRASMGRKIPAHSSMDFSDRDPSKARIQDPESGTMFNMTPPTMGKRLTELRELGYDLNKVAFLGEGKKIHMYEPPSSPPPSMPPPMPPPRTSLQRGQSGKSQSDQSQSGQSQSGQSQRSLLPHESPLRHNPPPDRAYIREGRVIIKRPPDIMLEEEQY